MDRLEEFILEYKSAIPIVPVWHGTKPELIEPICRSGFFNLATTDDGFFGKGIYGTPQAEYACRVYGNKCALLNLMALGSVYPVVHEDAKNLAGKANFGAYHSHYIPVKGTINSTVYTAMKEGDLAQYDEFVVFDPASILPRFIVFYEVITS